MKKSTAILPPGCFHLQVPCYRLWLYVGCSEHERAMPQPIDIDLSVWLQVSPRAVQTDKLADSFCYDTLLSKLAMAVQDTPFTLLEHVGGVLLATTERFLADQGYAGLVLVGVTKICPPIPGILGGVRIACNNGQVLA